MNWYDWHTVTERLQGRAYALTRGQPYKVTLDPTTSTGCCDFTNKRILINPDLFTDVLQKMGLSGNSLDKASFLVSRAITGHESLHVLFSDPEAVLEAARESQLLKMILNLLEDARIEKIGAETSHVSNTLFRFVNAIAAGQLPEFVDVGLNDRFSVVSLLLRWRLGAVVPRLDSAAETLWQQVLSLANRALHAPDCGQVLDLAREIVKIAGLDQQNAEDSKAMQDVEEVMTRMGSGMSGSRDSRPMPSPVGSRPDAGSGEPTDAGEPTDPDDPSDGSTDDTHHDAPDTTEDNSANADPAEGDPAAESGTDGSGQSGVSGEESSAREDCGEEEPADSHRGDVSNTTSPKKSDGELVHSVHSGRCELDSDELEKLVEEAALQVSEDLDSLVPRGDDHSLLVAKATAFRGRIYSDIVASPYAHYLAEAAPIAAELLRELRADGPRAVSGASESAGKFKTRYYIRDRHKPFSAQRFQGLTTPKMALSLVIDRSGSMEGIVHELRTMSMAITMACENLQIPLSIWALEGQVHIKHFDEHGPQVLAKIAGITADTLTRTMPTINDAVADLRSRSETLKQIVFIHDGMPSDRHDFVIWRNELSGIGLFCMFIMPEEEYQLHKDNPGQLRENMDDLVGRRNYAIAPVTDIAKHWCSFIRNTRSRHSNLVF